MSEVAVFRFALLLGCVAALAGLSGCDSGSPYATVPVSGTVVLADGGSLSGYAMKTIRLVPNSTDPEARPSSGEVKEDGTFKLGSKTANDGAIPGKYAVVATIMKNYPPTPADTSKTWVCDPAEIEVKEGMEPITIKVSAAKK